LAASGRCLLVVVVAGNQGIAKLGSSPVPRVAATLARVSPLDHASVIELDCLGGSVIQDASEFGKMFQGSGQRTLCVILDQLHHSKRPIEQPQCRVLYELS